MSSESTDTYPAAFAPMSGETKVLVAVQNVFVDKPGAVASARALSHFGEHSLGWLAVAGTGAAIAQIRGDERGRNLWVAAGVGAFGAHAASVVLKRIVRRKRPDHADVRIGVGTPSKLSFPSSHATSTTAAAILIGRAAGLPPAALPAALVPPMLLSRLVLGVHYPTDVIGGALIGAACAAAVGAGERLTRTESRGML
ncbi:phosphatase PAP2 family protein [Williamsia muralis]